MNTKEKRKAKEIAIALLLLLLLLWLLYHLFGGNDQPVSSNIEPFPGVGTVTPGTVTIPSSNNPTSSNSTSTPTQNCSCPSENGCPVSPYTIQSVQQMLQIGNAAANAINAAGNNTLETIAQMENSNFPLVFVYYNGQILEEPSNGTTVTTPGNSFMNGIQPISASNPVSVTQPVYAPVSPSDPSNVNDPSPPSMSYG